MLHILTRNGESFRSPILQAALLILLSVTVRVVEIENEGNAGYHSCWFMWRATTSERVGASITALPSAERRIVVKSKRPLAGVGAVRILVCYATLELFSRGAHLEGNCRPQLGRHRTYERLKLTPREGLRPVDPGWLQRSTPSFPTAPPPVTEDTPQARVKQLEWPAAAATFALSELVEADRGTTALRPRASNPECSLSQLVTAGPGASFPFGEEPS